ncbi:hypothetical protein ACULNC_07320 [Shigella flexneri]
MNIEEDNLAQALHDNRDLLGHVHLPITIVTSRAVAPSISTRCLNSCAPITIRVMWCMKGVSGRRILPRRTVIRWPGCVPAKRSL